MPGDNRNPRFLKTGDTMKETKTASGTPDRCGEKQAAAAQVGEDFADTLEDGEVFVAQWGDGFGWGAEARARLV